MELLLRFLGVLLRVIDALINPLLTLYGSLFWGRQQKFPMIRNKILQIPAVDLAQKIRDQEIKSEDVVRAYIERIRLVNPSLNAVVEERFSDAINDAKKADHMCATMPQLNLITNYPLLGIPFTVKESCGLKGMKLTGGSVPRKDVIAQRDGGSVALLKASGAIPLLVSATPEFCLSWECNTVLKGRTVNPYDRRRTPGGSSGGEGALLGAGASLIGVGSDIAGSIRVPAMFNGVFGHKPTAAVVSVDGHFPYSADENFSNYLTVGPMCRYAKDLPMLLKIMSGDNASKLRLDEPLNSKDIKIYYLEDAGYSLASVPVARDIKKAILRSVKHFKQNGFATERAGFGNNMQETIEISLSMFFAMQDIPDFLADPENPKKRDNLYEESFKSLIGRSKYSFAALFFFLLYETKGFISSSKLPYYTERGMKLKQQILNTLGSDGVLFYPTYPLPALKHYASFTNICGVMYSMFFNLIGFPATHVPLGFDKNGLPIGMQVIAAPYQDRLCLTIANELEAAFGGYSEPQ